MIHYRYANGVVVHSTGYPGETVGDEGGACFVGTEGRIAVDRTNIVSYPANILKEPLRPGDTRVYHADSHSGNFLECIRTPAADDLPPGNRRLHHERDPDRRHRPGPATRAQVGPGPRRIPRRRTGQPPPLLHPAAAVAAVTGTARPSHAIFPRLKGNLMNTHP